MADLKINPSKLKGEVKIPPSKSMAHRAIICAALSDGLCIIENIDYSDDIIATIDAMNSLGAKIVKHKDYIEVIGAYGSNEKAKETRVIDCNESGSTLRFLVPISLLFKGSSKFIGRGNLGKRPLTTYYHIFERQVYGLAPTEIIYRIALSFILGFDSNSNERKHNFRMLDALPYAKEGTLENKLDELFG